MEATNRQHLVVCSLGRMDYKVAWDLQRQIQARLIRAKRSEPPELTPHVLLLVEHSPVYTLGRSGNKSNLLLSEDALARHRADFHHIDRGGDITFHGPGQIVGYPILDLGRFFTDIHRYLRELEEMIIRTCADFGVHGDRFTGRTGVWVGPDQRGVERKICAMGIRCSRWVTMHGFAFNVNTDLSYFSHINPCGITDRGATSLSTELGRTIDEDEVVDALVGHFAQRFGTSVDGLSGDDASLFLERFARCEAAHVVRDHL
jgi:lipoyl(octanoyl) transferase